MVAAVLVGVVSPFNNGAPPHVATLYHRQRQVSLLHNERKKRKKMKKRDKNAY